MNVVGRVRVDMKPVKQIMARLGIQIAPEVPPGICAFVNAVPISTRRSILGVWIAGFPSA